MTWPRDWAPPWVVAWRLLWAGPLLLAKLFLALVVLFMYGPETVVRTWEALQ